MSGTAQQNAGPTFGDVNPVEILERPPVRSRLYLVLVAGVISASVATLAGCASSSAPAAEPRTDLEIGATDLSTDCPSPLVIQTNWNPEGEHGPLYELIGEDPAVDAATKAVTGPLMTAGSYTGIDVEVRAGGPAIGYQLVPSQMYTDPEITLGYVEVVEAIQNHAEMPTVSVFAQFDKDPGAVIWDPETYPDVESVADLAAAGARVLTFDGYNSAEWLVNSGIYPADLVDKSYDGTPATFVAAGGELALSAYGTAEPYIYEHDVESWAKPLEFQLYSDAGWPNYANTLAVRAGELKDLSPCLEKLVPVLQQAEIDYVASPDETNALIAELVEQYDTGWVYSKDVADSAAALLPELGLVQNGDNAYIGDFSEARVAESIDIMTTIMRDAGSELPADLAPSDVYTNEFLDETIGFAP